MKTTRVLILISSDPRNSPRPAEALRVAAGLAAGGRVRVMVFLGGAAAVLSEPLAFDLPGGEAMTAHLASLRASGGVLEPAPDRLAERVAQNETLLRF